MKDLTSLEAGRWMDAAPRIVQDVVTSPATEHILEELGKQYGLHVDAAGLLIKLTSYMLIGYAKPEESFQELRSAGVPEQQARQIIDEINKQIFVPLREQMRMKSGNTQSTSVAPQANVGVPNYAAPRPAGNPGIVLPPKGNYAPPPQSPRYPNQQQDNVNAFVHRVQRPSVNTMPPSISVIAPPAAKPLETPVRAAAPTSAPTSPGALLSDHEEPHIDFPPLAASPAQTRPTPPPNLPGAFPSLASAAPKMPPPPPASSSYSTDPYHEPIE